MNRNNLYMELHCNLVDILIARTGLEPVTSRV